MPRRLMSFLLILFSTNLNGQDSKRIFEPNFENQKGISALKATTNVVDEIRSKGRIVFMKLQTGDRFKEFYRISDTLLYSRELDHINAVDEGHYKLKVEKNHSIDTVITFDPETYEESISIYSYHDIQKTGDWVEYDSLGLEYRGVYYNNEKDGAWAISEKGRRVKTVYYENGKIIEIYNPSSSEINEYLKWIYDKDFIWCMKTFDDKSTKYSREIWRLNTNKEEPCIGFGKFQFRSDGVFSFSELKPVIKYGLYKEGLGKWMIISDEIEMIFVDGVKERFRLSQLGREVIRFERRNDSN